jgi:beta-phosphoglucomutase
MLRAVIFDFDGVITDSELLHLASFNSVLGELGIELGKDEYYSDYLGLSDYDLLSLMVSSGKIELSKDEIDKLVKKKNKVFKELAITDGAIIDGVRDFLDLLDSKRIPAAICSGAVMSEIMLILDRATLKGYFREIVSADQVTKSKPDPEGFVLALKRLNNKLCSPIKANECVVIEDARWGIEAANKAGMQTVAVINTYDAKELTMAKKIISNLRELSIDDMNLLCS